MIYVIVLTIALINPSTNQILDQKSFVQNTPEECIKSGEDFKRIGAEEGRKVNYICEIKLKKGQPL